MSNIRNGKNQQDTGKWGKMALLTAAVAAWLIYDMATATETPRQAVMILQYILLAGALFSLGVSLLKLTSPK
jgi:hypothetical protein